MVKRLPGRIWLVAFGCFFFVNGFAQGAWNINYLTLDALNESFLGRELRIDFASSGVGKLKYSYGSNVSTIFADCDTVTLRVLGHAMQFVERWKIYADHGVLRD